MEFLQLLESRVSNEEIKKIIATKAATIDVAVNKLLKLLVTEADNDSLNELAEVLLVFSEEYALKLRLK